MIIVTNTKDSGAGSLRDAINSAAPGEIITFDSSLSGKTITLTSGELVIYEDLTIDGENAPGLTISGNNSSRVIDIRDINYVAPDVAVKNLTIADGKTTQNGEDGAGAGIRTAYFTDLYIENVKFINNFANGDGGGAIFAGYQSTNTVINSIFENNKTLGNASSGKSERGGGAIAIKSHSSLLVQNSEFTNNAGTNGGAINTLLTEFVVEDSTFINNNTLAALEAKGFKYQGFGGAIFSDAITPPDDNIGGILRISNSLFDGNIGAGQGGGLFLFGHPPDQVIVENSTIINNQVLPNDTGKGLGGGLRQGNSELILSNTTIANNKAHNLGGGLWVGEKAPVTITNSTFSGNRAESDDGKKGIGGGIMISNYDGYSVNIDHTTVVNNYAGWQGGGFWSENKDITLSNSIFAYNEAYNGGNNWNVYHHTNKTLIDGGNNIQSTELNSNDTKITTGAVLGDPLLGDLKNNGGGMLTHAPLPGSPVLNAGSVGEALDQRGVSRVNPDLGAFEQFQVGFSLNASDGDEPTSGSFIDQIKVKLSQKLDFNLSVPYTVGGTATSGSDFKPLSGTLVVPAGKTIANIPVEILTDNKIEGDETIVLTLGSVNDSYILDKTVYTYTINDNGSIVSGPNAPSNFKASPISESVIKLTWQDNSNDETGFVIERSTNNVNWNYLTTTEANVKSYQDQGLTKDTQYYYRISATNGSGNSEVITVDAKTYNLIVGTNNNDQLNGWGKNDIIKGFSGDDLLNGGGGSDKLYGDNGNDTLKGGLGNDILTGGGGNDVFGLTSGEGQDQIIDFHDNIDTIGLSGVSFNSLSIIDSNNNSLVKNGNETLGIIVGVNSSLLTANDFVQF